MTIVLALVGILELLSGKENAERLSQAIVSSPALVAMLSRWIHHDDVEQYAPVIHRQSPCKELTVDDHLA